MIGHSRNKSTKIQVIPAGWDSGHVRFAGVEAQYLRLNSHKD